MGVRPPPSQTSAREAPTVPPVPYSQPPGLHPHPRPFPRRGGGGGTHRVPTTGMSDLPAARATRSVLEARRGGWPTELLGDAHAAIVA